MQRLKPCPSLAIFVAPPPALRLQPTATLTCPRHLHYAISNDLENPESRVALQEDRCQAMENRHFRRTSWIKSKQSRLGLRARYLERSLVLSKQDCGKGTESQACMLTIFWNPNGERIFHRQHMDKYVLHIQKELPLQHQSFKIHTRHTVPTEIIYL